MRHIFIVNPVSGKADASGTLVPRIITAAKGLEAEYEVQLTEYPGHAVQLARQAAQSGPVRLYACGGDGTLNEVLMGARESETAEVACVPCGSGNDFVRNFGGGERFLDLPDLIQGHAVPIDLIETQYGISAAICSAGLDAQVAYGIPKFRRLPLCGGSMAYNLSIAQCVCGRMGHKLRVTADGEVLEDDFLMLAICNGCAYGGGFVTAPEADMNDGELDLVLVKKISRLRMARVIGLYKSGAHIQNGRVAPEVADIITYKRVRQVELETLDGRPIVVTQDGECAPRNTLTAKVKPSAARVVLPKSWFERRA